MNFSDNLERLDVVLRRLEGDPLSLDEALLAFEEGVGLVKESRAFLDKAEQRVTLLTQDGEVPFEAGEKPAPGSGESSDLDLKLEEAPF